MNKTDASKITAVVLAGGQSRRMGRNKALLEWNGESFLEHICNVLHRRFELVYVSGAEAVYGALAYTCIEDTYGDTGPLGALASVLEVVDSEWIFVLSCDTPLVKVDFIELMCAKASVENVQAIVPIAKDKFMPLLAMYHKSILPVVRKQLQLGNLRMMSLLDQLTTKFVVLDVEMQEQLKNINTPMDLKRFKEENQSFPERKKS